jgi:hypothetical protein
MILKWVHEKLNASKVNFWIFNFFWKDTKNANNIINMSIYFLDFFEKVRKNR